MLDPDLQVDESTPVFEGNTYSLKMVLFSDLELRTRKSIASATWISCSIYDEHDPTVDKIQATLASGVTKTDAANGEALATFTTVQTGSLLPVGRRYRTMRYEWAVVMDGETKTVRWGHIKVYPSAGAS